MFYHKTTKAHFKKFEKMIKNAKLSLKECETFFGYSKEKLEELYQKDNLLNNIVLQKFDNRYFCLQPSARKFIKNLADNCCCFKHLLIYEVLGATPIVIDL